MKKIKLLIAAMAMVGLMSSSIAYAGGFAPGEGLYVGVFGGVSTGIVQPKVAVTDNVKLNSADGTDTTYEVKEGGLALTGIQGGGWLGYGYKMGDFYIGWDMDYAGSGEEFKLTSDVGVEVDDSDGALTITEIKAERKFRGAGAARIGYYINDDTLFTVKGGIHASEFSINDGSGNSEDVYAGGWGAGVSLESRIAAIDPSLSIRLEATYDDYLTAPISGIGSSGNGQGTSITGLNRIGVATGGHSNNIEITGSGTNLRLGLQYSFFDVNSLF